MAALFPVPGLPVPLGPGEGRGQKPHSRAPGAEGVFFLWGREGHDGKDPRRERREQEGLFWKAASLSRLRSS